MKKIIVTATFAFISASVFSQAQLVKDINTTTAIQHSSPSKFLTITGVTYFTAMNLDYGYELWKTDGTDTGTVMVKDISPGTAGSNINNLINVNGTLFFSASANAKGFELWKSDGTEDGTVMVKDINPGTGSSITSPSSFAVIGSTLYFPATDGINGYELWKSDGTDAGTVLVKDIYPGVTNSSPGSLTVMGSNIYFRASDGTNGAELWKSDGTTGGTVLVKDIWPGISSSSPLKLMAIGNTLFFRASDSTASGNRGIELWKSNGTTIGTAQIMDINPGSGDATPDYLTAIGTTLYFSADNFTYGQEIWRCDPPYASANTIRVTDINPNVGNSNTQYLTNVNGILFFSAYDLTNGTELWLSGGDSTTTGLVKDIYPGITNSSPTLLTVHNNNLYFVANESSGGSELWRSDGTVNGTFQVKDIEAGTGSSSPTNLFSNGSLLLFSAITTTSGTELWKSDGTSVGTNLLLNINPEVGSSSPSFLTKINNTIYFGANDGMNGTELWKSDGTSAGTAMIKDIYPGTGSSLFGSIDGLQNINGTLFFAAQDGTNGVELWKSDGTVTGTFIVTDIYPGASGSYPAHFMNVNGTLFFFANNGTTGNELWKSDGTPGGTVFVKDINPGTGSSNPSSYSGNMVSYNNKLYFQANDGTNGNELWVSDGTTGGTTLVKDIYTGASYGSPYSLTVSNGKLFFYATDPTNGTELWMSDGTTGGTALLKDIMAGPTGSSPVSLFDMNGTLFFGANDGGGSELWKSDGTSSGTVLIKNIWPGNSPNFSQFTKINNTLFFRSKDAAAGSELWKTDGTTAGTVLVKDLWPGTGASLPSNLVNFHDTLFYSGRNSTQGTELFVSAETAQTTGLAADIYPGVGSSTPLYLVATTNNLFFMANDGVNGKELWKLSMPPALQGTSLVTNLICNEGTNGAIDLTVTGGTAPYHFMWSSSDTTEDVTGLTSGNYSVVIRDAWGWSITKNFPVNAPTAVTVSLISQTNVTCNGGNNGAVTVSTTGGTSSYSYLWSPGGEITENISGLIANNYSVLVTDALGCIDTFSTIVTQPQALAATTNSSNTSCYAGTNGTATVNVTIGIAPYSYLWSANAGSQTTQTATGLSAGIYTVTVTDYTGCQKTFMDSLTQPSAFLTGVIATDVNCSGGSNGGADLSVSGASPPYTYLWSNAATTQDISNVAAASYTITITDSKGCIKTNIAIVGQPATFSANITKTDITCNGLSDGTATATANGGSAPYIYSWQTSPAQNNQTATALSSGSFNVSITDNHGCVITPSISILEPAILSVSVSKTDATCGNADGNATANVLGGTTPYSYLWSGGGTNQVANNLSTGNYFLIASDANGCTSSDSAYINTSIYPQSLCMVTVDSLSSHTIIYWEKSLIAGIDSFKIYREITTNNYGTIASVASDSLSEYHDYEANPNVTSYKYKITAKDSCGNESALSDYHNTIHLQNLGFGNLQWTLYEIENTGNPVTYYRVYRDDTNSGIYLPISTTIPGGNSTFTDIAYYLYPNANYRVDVAWSISCSPTRATINTTRSNIKGQGISIGIQTNENSFPDINIYPNPANESLTIELNQLNEASTIQIVNILGQLSDEIVLPASTSKTIKKINLNGYAKGVYTVSIESNGIKRFNKLVVN